jgi:hypothetical protein
METGPLIVDLREAADTCPLVDECAYQHARLA